MKANPEINGALPVSGMACARRAGIWLSLAALAGGCAYSAPFVDPLQEQPVFYSQKRDVQERVMPRREAVREPVLVAGRDDRDGSESMDGDAPDRGSRMMARADEADEAPAPSASAADEEPSPVGRFFSGLFQAGQEEPQTERHPSDSDGAKDETRLARSEAAAPSGSNGRDAEWDPFASPDVASGRGEQDGRDAEDPLRLASHTPDQERSRADVAGGSAENDSPGFGARMGGFFKGLWQKDESPAVEGEAVTSEAAGLAKAGPESVQEPATAQMAKAPSQPSGLMDSLLEAPSGYPEDPAPGREEQHQGFQDGPFQEDEQAMAPGGLDGHARDDGYGFPRTGASLEQLSAPPRLMTRDGGGSVREAAFAPSFTEAAPGSLNLDGERYVVRLGSYASRLNAQLLKERVESLGLPVVDRPVEAHGRTFRRIFSGPFTSREAAERARGLLLDQEGLEGDVSRVKL